MHDSEEDKRSLLVGAEQRIKVVIYGDKRQARGRLSFSVT